MARPAHSRPFSNVTYAHPQKPEWGAALIVWETDGKRGYRFEDGELRVFKEGYFDRLQVEDVGPERLARLRETIPLSITEPELIPTERGSAIGIDEQLHYFLGMFPGGFTGAEWAARSRGKSNRAAAVARAQIDLEQRRLGMLISNNDSERCVTDLCALIASTDLVAARELKLLERLPYHTTSVVAECLVDLLWSEQAPILSFSAWTSILAKATGAKVSWMLATVPLALLKPDRHVIVKNTVFMAQAQTTALSLRLDRTPAWAMYERAQAMAQTLFDQLNEGGAGARDFLDVYDFIAVTQRPKSRGEILSRR